MSNEHDGVGKKYLAPYLGTVLDNAPPDDLRGQVRITVPGIIEESDWCPVVGEPGGGTARRGLHAPLAKGAHVVVWFLGGDVEAPVCLPGPRMGPPPGPGGGYGRPDNEGNPGADPGLSADDAAQVVALETDRWVLIFDDREGKRAATLEDKRTGDHVRLDGEKGSVDIKATGTLFIRCDGQVFVDGGKVTLADRPVQKNGKVV